MDERKYVVSSNIYQFWEVSARYSASQKADREVSRNEKVD